jgi:hypothetical protein
VKPCLCVRYTHEYIFNNHSLQWDKLEFKYWAPLRQIWGSRVEQRGVEDHGVAQCVQMEGHYIHRRSFPDQESGGHTYDTIWMRGRKKAVLLHSKCSGKRSKYRIWSDQVAMLRGAQSEVEKSIMRLYLTRTAWKMYCDTMWIDFRCESVRFHLNWAVYLWTWWKNGAMGSEAI